MARAILLRVHGSDRESQSLGKERLLRTSEQGGKNILHLAVAARKTGPDCGCKRNCFVRVSEDERGAILSSFYGLADKDLQDAHLFGLIQPVRVKRRRPRGGGTPHQATYTYEVN